ncbi:hypothetical protein GF339_02915 [candidate division KSB3 bacterium]|uniref:Carrier domain-containing protein n=1 Tax=candidate division KSB3 bacterium TaxID=2044937 RepID=A0A9D5Q530_9BACT|nr:hypothetical protein [candidate division KSB3 bacterium]MBD3323506.1 hypothetical protein [candidate division KSB3 bacterium]
MYQHGEDGGATMARVLTDQEKQHIYDEVRQFLAEELEIDLEEIQEDTNIIDDIGGDSLLYLELVEEFKQEFDVNVEVRVIGQYMLKKSITTVREAVDAIYEVIEKGDQIVQELEQGEQAVQGS